MSFIRNYYQISSAKPETAKARPSTDSYVIAPCGQPPSPSEDVTRQIIPSIALGYKPRVVYQRSESIVPSIFQHADEG